VFELFQDLDGFCLDDYRPFADVQPGLDRVLGFLRVALEAEGKKAAARDDGTYVMTGGNEAIECRFTLNREAARERAGLELLGLDHPLVQMKFIPRAGIDAFVKKVEAEAKPLGR
jgi:hypothetical protein